MLALPFVSKYQTRGLSRAESAYNALHGDEAKKQFFLRIRERFNSPGLSLVVDAAYMIFLNRTCFNGLYRENSRGEFYNRMSEMGCDVLLSNSDGTVAEPANTYIDEFYKDFIIERTIARRSISCAGASRRPISELLIRNYSECLSCAE